MAYLGNRPTAVPLTGADLTDGIITPAKLSTTLDLSSKTITLPSGVGGKVLQTKYMQTTSSITLSTTSLVDLALTNTITPSSTSSKIIIQFFIQARLENAEGYGTAIKRAISGGATTTLNEMPSYYCLNWSTGGEIDIPSPYMFEDNPNTISEITYTIQVKGNTTSAIQVPNAGSFNSLLIMEVSA